MRAMTRFLSVSATALALAGCNSLDVTDLNNPGLATLDSPSAALVNNAASGLLVGVRQGVATPNGYVMLTAILGREGYNLNNNSDPRYITEMVEGPLKGGSQAFGSNF